MASRFKAGRCSYFNFPVLSIPSYHIHSLNLDLNKNGVTYQPLSLYKERKMKMNWIVIGLIIAIA